MAREYVGSRFEIPPVCLLALRLTQVWWLAHPSSDDYWKRWSMADHLRWGESFPACPSMCSHI